MLPLKTPSFGGVFCFSGCRKGGNMKTSPGAYSSILQICRTCLSIPSCANSRPNTPSPKRTFPGSSRYSTKRIRKERDDVPQRRSSKRNVLFAEVLNAGEPPYSEIERRHAKQRTGAGGRGKDFYRIMGWLLSIACKPFLWSKLIRPCIFRSSQTKHQSDFPALFHRYFHREH